jgi:hypothetical protein
MTILPAARSSSGARRAHRKGQPAPTLLAGERGGRLAALVFAGVGIGALWKALSWVFNLLLTEIGYTAPRTSQFPNATLAADVSPEYLGVGYVIGPRIAGERTLGRRRAGVRPLQSILGAHRAVSADPSQLRQQSGHRPAVPDLGNERRPALERLHPLHRRRRRAGGGAHFPHAHAAHHRRVGRDSLKDDGGAEPASASAPNATARDRQLGGSAALVLFITHAGNADAGTVVGPDDRLRLPFVTVAPRITASSIPFNRCRA